MAMTHTFDLQRFADSNVQTTGTQSLSAEMKTYYGMELLENAKPALAVSYTHLRAHETD